MNISRQTVATEPITRRGKFLHHGPDKFFVSGATYGAFPPNSRGDQFPERIEAVQDLALMRGAGINTILTYTVPPSWLLDELHARGMKAIITTPWMDHICFLHGRRDRQQVHGMSGRALHAVSVIPPS